MSTMVMCHDTNPSGVFQRHPSPTNFTFPFSGYGGQSSQYNQDYSQFQLPTDHSSMQQAWYNAMYSNNRGEDWTNYMFPSSTASSAVSPQTMGTYSYRSSHMGLDYSQTSQGQCMTPLGSAQPLGSPGDSSSSSSSSGSPTNKQLRPPFDWMKKSSYQNQPAPGKTRTKDKYRVVYSDHQRLELEKEFHYSRYITIRRKAELAQTLSLSERQVKIWFQNRRAKERKQNKKRQENTGSDVTNNLVSELQEELQQHVQSHAQHMQISPPHNQHPMHSQVSQSPSPLPVPVQQSLTQHQLPTHTQLQGHPHIQVKTQLPLSPPPMQTTTPVSTPSPVQSVTIKTDIQDIVSSV